MFERNTASPHHTLQQQQQQPMNLLWPTYFLKITPGDPWFRLG